MRNRLLAVVLSCASLLLPSAAAAADAQLVFATPGQDASTQMLVSWHAAVPGTLLEYTKKTDPSFASSSSIACGSVPLDTTFSSASFYRCTALLDGLETDTEYLFRVGAGSPTTSQQFKTAYGRGGFSFVWMSDIHAYPPIPGRMDKAEALFSRAEEIQDAPAFVLVTGDMTAHGANYTHWQALSEGSFCGSLPMAATPGNHDYYDSSATTIDDRFFNAALAAPENGHSAASNATYWFRYDNALFISVNSEDYSSSAVAAQKAWLREVIADNPAQYVIVFTHRAFFKGSTTTAGSGVVRKSSNTYANYGALLEELDVDLALAGDDHVYVRTREIKGGAVATTGRGTVYLSANQIGDRGALAAASLGEYGAAIYGGTSGSGSISTASVITISDSSIDGVLFDAAGAVHDSFSIPARRSAPVDDFDKDAYARSFSVRVNPPDLSRGALSFTDQGWDRVRNIEVRDAEAGAVYASFTPRAGMTESTFGALEAGRTYQLTITILFKDGDTRAVSAVLVDKLPPGSCRNLRLEEVAGVVLLKWENELVPGEIDRIGVSVNDVWRTDAPVDGESVEVTPGLQEGANTVGFVVVDRYGDEVFSESLSYDYSPEIDAGTTQQTDAGEAVDAAQDEQLEEQPSGDEWSSVTAEGCSCSSSPASPAVLFMALAGFCAFARRRAGACDRGSCR